MTEVLTQVPNFKFKFDTKNFLQNNRNFYNLDYYSSYNDFSKLIFNDNSNQFENKMG